MTEAHPFGDGSASIAQDASHAYTIAGTYTVGLTVTDAVGVSVSTTSITINVYPSLGVVASATPLSGQARLKVTFVAAAIGGLGPFTYSWSFGDGATGTGPNVAHTYKAGTYQPTLTVHDAAGGSWHGTVGTVTVVRHSPKATATNTTLAVTAPSSTPPSQTNQPTPAPSAVSPSPVGSHDADSQRSSGGGDGWRFWVLVGSFLTAVGVALSFARWLVLRT